MMLTAMDIQEADLSEPLVLFWHHHQEGAWNKLTTATLSWHPKHAIKAVSLTYLDCLEISGRKLPDSGSGYCLLLGLGVTTKILTRSMQGMFGASVSELYLLIKLLITIERTDLCVITKKK